MWILKGMLLGTLVFGVGLIIYSAFVASRVSSQGPVSWDVRSVLTMWLHSPSFWMAFVGTIVIGCALVRTWPAKSQLP